MRCVRGYNPPIRTADGDVHTVPPPPADDPRFAAAVAKHQAGELAAAEKLYRELLAADPKHAPAWCNLGALLVAAGNLADAGQCYQYALQARPGFPDAHFNLGNLYRRIGRLPDAAAAYRACLTGNPTHASAAFNLALTLAAAGELSSAEDLYRKLLAGNPSNSDLHARLGDVLYRGGNFPAAIAHHRRAADLAPNDPRTWYNLGLALNAAGDPADAEAACRTALALKPDYPEPHNLLGLIAESNGRKDDAEALYRDAVRLGPTFADGWSNLGINLGEQGRNAESLEALAKSLELRPAPHIHSNYLLLLNYSSIHSREQVFAEHAKWAARYAPPAIAPPKLAPHDPNRRLRIGYVSPDFRTHTVAGLIEILLKHHDRGQVEVFAYPNVSRPDAKTEHFRGLADHWKPIVGASDDRAAEMVRSDGIDVLVDLAGHTAGNRLGIFARRPAAIQATMFGYPNTTGLTAFDARITDAIYDPPGTSESVNSEPLLRIENPCWVYRPPDAAPAVGPLPAATNAAFTFGCLNNPAKASDACLDAWAKLLLAVPTARLAMTGSQSNSGAARIRERFAAVGVSADRVDLRPRVPFEQYLAAYGGIDVALDPFPFNGGITTGDALWMGVPVLAVAGNTYAGRQGIAVLSAVGLNDFVARDTEHLVELGSAWANRRDELAAIRAGLRDRIAASPFCDAVGYVRKLEAAFRRLWQSK